ncbi:MAG: cytochrome b N-terminal domain-containing protein [Chloroflexi bacterium]|nr:cytochrome b N-terminal domain-containing protein [Chloroflexota bacterium]
MGAQPSIRRGIRGWLDERVALGPFVKAIFLRHMPVGLNWWYSLGSACLLVLGLQVVTGILMALSYAPTPEYAYDSVRYITYELPFGWFVRGLHHWGASAMVVLVLLHLISVFIMGAYKYPREAVWMVGVGLFLITLGFSLTGYLLPWDQKAYWATTVVTNVLGTVPVVGDELAQLVRGGTALGIVTLTRFYAIHTMILPLTIGILALAHVALVVYHGVSVPPGLWHRGVGKPGAPAPEPAPASYQERYAAFKAHGPRFWPGIIAEDLRVGLVVFLILVGLTVFVGVPLDERADPTDTAYIPRPEWYFMAIFESLKFFPGYLEWVGAVLIPGLLVLLLFLVPFLSRGEERRPFRRPLGMATLAVILLGLAGLTARAYMLAPPAEVTEYGVVLTSKQLRGRQLVQQEGCRSCHVIAGEADAKEGEQVKGPLLDGIGERMTAADVHLFMERPKVFNPEAEMSPLIPLLTHEDVDAITQYLLTLPGEALLAKGGTDERAARP